MKIPTYNKLSASLSSSKLLKAFVIRFTLFAAILTVAAVNGNAVSPGAPDFTFGTRGITTLASENIQATVIQADGKILIAGYTTDTNTDFNFKLARLNANGTLDNSFGINGIVVTNFSSQNETISDIVVQADGKIVVAGSSYLYNQAQTVIGFQIVRYMPDGSLDIAFGTSGRVYDSFENVGAYAKSIIIQPDGKIVVAGNSSSSRLSIVRYNADGSLDSSFGTNGKVFSNFNFADDTKIARQVDGKIVVVAARLYRDDDYSVKLIRYNTNGTLDGSFGSGGTVTTTFLKYIFPEIAFQSDGKIILSGKYNIPGSSPPLRRFNSDGSVDTSFAAEVGPLTNGRCTSCTQSVEKILMLPDNRFYLVGYNLPNILSVSRYLSNGALDPSFGFRGASQFRTFNDYLFYDFPTDAALQADGKIILAGSRGDNGYNEASNFVMRINTTVTAGTVRGDFDGDGKTDFSVFRPSDRTWYTLNSSDNSIGAAQYGLGTDAVTPGDYNYDRKTDFSVFRPSVGWYVAQNQTNEIVFGVNNFGQTGDVSAPEDYDGDGKTDFAVFRPSNGTWYIHYSSQLLQNAPVSSVRFGQDGDKPVAGDYDGDGRADISVFRPSTGAWYILRSSDNGFFGIQFGIGTDRVVPADYDGDLKTDVAVYRDGFWYILRSSDNGFFAIRFGEAADKPVSGDFDGDGKADVAVYRPNAGSWYVLKSSNGAFVGQQWGISEDIPIPNAFVR